MFSLGSEWSFHRLFLCANDGEVSQWTHKKVKSECYINEICKFPKLKATPISRHVSMTRAAFWLETSVQRGRAPQFSFKFSLVFVDFSVLFVRLRLIISFSPLKHCCITRCLLLVCFSRKVRPPTHKSTPTIWEVKCMRHVLRYARKRKISLNTSHTHTFIPSYNALIPLKGRIFGLLDFLHFSRTLMAHNIVPDVFLCSITLEIMGDPPSRCLQS